MISPQLDTGYLLTWIIAGGIAGIMAIVAIVSGIMWLPRRGDYSAWGFVALCTAVACVVAGGIGIAGTFPPFSMQYHRYVPYTGTVKQVNSRFIGDGQSTSQFYPVQFTNGDIRRCDDSRCTALKPGDVVTLLCERTFQFNATEGWSCNWGKLGANR